MAIYIPSTLDRTFHALGNDKRRAMLTLLARKGEATAGELGRPLHISQPTASKHLQVLERAGLLSRHIQGRVHRFRLVIKPLADAERWISRHRDFWEGTLDRLGHYLDDFTQGADVNG